MKILDIIIIIICIIALLSSLFEGFQSIQKQGFKNYWNSLERKYNMLLIILALYIIVSKFNV
jgi:hypothetical protein